MDVKNLTEKEKGFYCGFICALSNLVHSHGTGTETRELFTQIEKPSAKFVRDLGLSEYDREAMNILRKEDRR